MPRAKTQKELLFIEAAANNNYEAVVQILKQGGIDVNVQEDGKDGHTALHWAAINGHLELAKLLVGMGADTNVLDDLGTTALHVAQSHCTSFGKQGSVAEFLIGIEKQRGEIQPRVPDQFVTPPIAPPIQTKNPNMFFTVKPFGPPTPILPTVTHQIQTIDKTTIEIQVTPETVTPYAIDDEEDDAYPYATTQTEPITDNDGDEINYYQAYDDAEEKFERDRIYRKF